jgi:hypothetical protein
LKDHSERAVANNLALGILHLTILTSPAILDSLPHDL